MGSAPRHGRLWSAYMTVSPVSSVVQLNVLSAQGKKEPSVRLSHITEYWVRL